MVTCICQISGFDIFCPYYIPLWNILNFKVFKIWQQCFHPCSYSCNYLIFLKYLFNHSKWWNLWKCENLNLTRKLLIFLAYPVIMNFSWENIASHNKILLPVMKLTIIVTTFRFTKWYSILKNQCNGTTLKFNIVSKYCIILMKRSRGRKVDSWILNGKE